MYVVGTRRVRVVDVLDVTFSADHVALDDCRQVELVVAAAD